nr:sigma 54-interacting transcriptional regulator [Deltaproteobacteria bacterium]
TGATERRKGRFEEAQGGTLFLDEIGEIDKSTQVKLLRALGERTIERVGGNQPIKVDVRVVAATNRNLAAMVAEGQFRVDLYHRIRQIELALPPLREREEDIPLLAERFLADFRATYDRRIELDDSAVELLRGLYWEGNVRQLRQTIERLAFLVEGETIRAEHLRAFGDDQVAGMAATLSQHAKRWLSLPFRQATDEFQKVYFQALLQATGGDLDEIARRSGYTRKGLQGVGRRLDLPLGGADRG